VARVAFGKARKKNVYDLKILVPENVKIPILAEIIPDIMIMDQLGKSITLLKTICCFILLLTGEVLDSRTD
jgi:hypothetical protein